MGCFIGLVGCSSSNSSASTTSAVSSAIISSGDQANGRPQDTEMGIVGTITEITDTAITIESMGGGSGGPQGEMPDGEPPSGETPNGSAPSSTAGEKPDGEPPSDMVQEKSTTTFTISSSTVFTNESGEVLTSSDLSVGSMVRVKLASDGLTADEIEVMSQNAQIPESSTITTT